jgi:hypothetical protein
MNVRSGIIVIIVLGVFGCGQNQEKSEAHHENNFVAGKKIDTLQLKSKLQGLWEEKPNGVPYFLIQGDSIFYPHRDYDPNSYVLAVDTLVEKEKGTGNILKYVINKVEKDSLYIYNLNKDQQVKLHRREIDDI